MFFLPPPPLPNTMFWSTLNEGTCHGQNCYLVCILLVFTLAKRVAMTVWNAPTIFLFLSDLQQSPWSLVVMALWQQAHSWNNLIKIKCHFSALWKTPDGLLWVVRVYYGKAFIYLFILNEVYNIRLPGTLLDSQPMEICFFGAAIQNQWEGTAAVLPEPDAHGYARPTIVAAPAVHAPCHVQQKRISY